MTSANTTRLRSQASANVRMLGRRATRNKVRYDGIDAVDLFCGGGGLTCGLRQAGIDVRMGVDFDDRCEYAYEHNNHAKFLHKSVTDVTAEEVRDNFRKGHVSLLAGCAPCQTFSKYNQKATWRDKRWLLLDQFTRLVKETKPQLVTMENVPKLEDQKVFSRFTDALHDLGYHVCHQVEVWYNMRMKGNAE